jgi:hypothetical protein
MTLYFIIIVASIVALGCVAVLIRSLSVRSAHLDQLSKQLRPIDVSAFRNLIDHSEREYLRTHLSSKDFRRIQRERMLAASEYVRCAARNAGILIRLGHASLNDPDPSVASVAASMLENAMRLRLHALQSLPKIYVSILLPGINWMPQGLPEGCDKVNRQALILGCLQVPAR